MQTSHMVMLYIYIYIHIILYIYILYYYTIILLNTSSPLPGPNVCAESSNFKDKMCFGFSGFPKTSGIYPQETVGPQISQP